MVVLGLTGGIGAGKSTVATMLAERGAVVVDTDTIAHEVVAPDGAAYAAVIERFGPDVVAPGGGLDRSALAEVVFDDAGALADLNAIVHPAVADVVAAELATRAGSDDVVVLVVPLLFEAGWQDRVDAVMVVDCSEDIARRRLVDSRGMDEADVALRMAAQVSRDQRLAGADYVVPNDGTLDDLRDQVAAAWRWIADL